MTTRVAPPLLDDAAVTEALAGLPGWEREGDRLVRTWRTGDWRGAMLLANGIALACEIAWHHPILTVAWGSVRVELWTHESGGITGRDTALAARLEQVVAWRPPIPLEGVPQGRSPALLWPD